MDEFMTETSSTEASAVLDNDAFGSMDLGGAPSSGDFGGSLDDMGGAPVRQPSLHPQYPSTGNKASLSTPFCAC